jgi:hypothetical protein
VTAKELPLFIEGYKLVGAVPSRGTPSCRLHSVEENCASKGSATGIENLLCRSWTCGARRTSSCFARVALAQQVQIELLRVLRSQCAELTTLKGSETELQQKLSLIEDLSRQAPAAAVQLDALPYDTGNDEPDEKKKRSTWGPTEPSLPIVDQTFELDAADRTRPSCGGALRPMKAKFETSEMIDVVKGA